MLRWLLGTDYDSGAERRVQSHLEYVFRDSKYDIELRDEEYQVLQVEKAKRLVSNCFTKWADYHPEFPDCDDFVWVLLGDVIREAYRGGCRLKPAIFTAVLEKNRARHFVLIFLVMENDIEKRYVVEAQTGRWRLQEPDEVLEEVEG